jgi:hypothetical protein
VTLTTSSIAGAILRDRQRHKKIIQKPPRLRVPGHGFDPFSVTRWGVLVGGDPGYLPKAQMRMSSTGWSIACQCCTREFESRGLAYCPNCMALPTEERRQQPLSGWRPCQVAGCVAKISPRRRFDAKYCEHHSAGRNSAKLGAQPAGQKYEDTRKIPQLDQGRFPSHFGPTDFPKNLIGGDRRGRALPRDLAKTIIKRELP